MLKKLLSFIIIFAISISPVFAKEFEGFYYYYYLPENGSFNHYETRSGKTTVDEAISRAIQKGEYHELETLLETSRVDPKTAEKIVELVKKNKLKEAEELFETGQTSAGEFVSETSTSSWTGFRYDYGSIANAGANLTKIYGQINKKLLTKDGKIDMSKFSQRVKNSGAKPDLKDPKTGWRISPDRAGANSHQSDYKLLDKNGKRIATISKDGKILRP